MTRRAPSLSAVFAGAAGLGALHRLDAAFVDPWHGETVWSWAASRRRR